MGMVWWFQCYEDLWSVVRRCLFLRLMACEYMLTIRHCKEEGSGILPSPFAVPPVESEGCNPAKWEDDEPGWWILYPGTSLNGGETCGMFLTLMKSVDEMWDHIIILFAVAGAPATEQSSKTKRGVRILTCQSSTITIGTHELLPLGPFFSRPSLQPRRMPC